jgi:hypothetical protein
VQFTERAQVPGHQVAHRDDGGDGRGHRRADPVVADRCDGGRAGEQAAQRRHRGLRAGQVLLETRQVRGDELVARAQVSRLQHGVNLVERHVQIPETADDLGCRDLAGRVPAVSGVRVDVGRRQEPDAVIVAQRLDAQMRGA